MPPFGAHMSTAGGLHRALERAAGFGCEAVQLFTKNSNQWKGKPLTDPEVEQFRRVLAESGLARPAAHDSYLINLASPDEATYRKSIDAFEEELRRAERLGLSYLVTHPGAHLGSGEEEGLRRVAAAIDEVHARCPGFGVRILLENTAGQGTCLGHRFEHLADVLGRVADPARLGVCFDTCHAVAAGYPLAPRRAYEALWEEFDRRVGLGRVELFHLNDSKKPLGSRVDRHEHIGEGHVGLEAFRLLVNDPRFADRPMVLETPKEQRDGEEMDARNLARLRKLVGKRRPIP
ncbi:MAG TPA: deoxyribonuclease IV [Gemmataceae bacterium]